MNSECPIIDALVYATTKRQIFPDEQARYFGEMLSKNGTTDLASLRHWLNESMNVNPELIRSLLVLLPNDGVPRFGKYEALIHLAEGGMGSVWIGRDSETNKLIIIKALRKNLAQGEEFIHRFKREAEIMRALSHPSFVRFIEADAASDGTLYMVLELVPYGTIKDLVSGSPVDEVTGLRIMHQMGVALGIAQEHELIHRDIKPANIFAHIDGRAKLADFGLARSTSVDRTALTMQGAMVGTPLYMSPEQIRGAEDLDIRTDIYSLGCVFFYSMTGREPFQGKFHEVMRAHQTEAPPEVASMRDDVSSHADQIIARCMAKVPADRYPDPSAFIEACELALKALGADVLDENSSAGDAARAMLQSHPFEETVLPTSNDSSEALSQILTSTAIRNPVKGPKGRTIDDDESASYSRNETSIISQTRTPVSGARASATQSVSDEDLGATVVSNPSAAGVDCFEGDINEAMTQEWLILADIEEGSVVVCYAKPQVCLGKMRETPVDICLRNYPVSVHKQACQKISRQHYMLRFDARLDAVLVEDLGSGNGTIFDGKALEAHRPEIMHPGPEHLITAAGTIDLHMRCIPARGTPITRFDNGLSGSTSQICGVEQPHRIDAVVMSRHRNRPEMSYAMVLRQMSIGAAGSDCVLVDAVGVDGIDLARFDGRWIWREQGDGPWKPLGEGRTVRCVGKNLTAYIGDYAVFR